MNAAITMAEQVRDLDCVAKLWCKLGHTKGSIAAYRKWMLDVLKTAKIGDYYQLTGDRVVRLASLYAKKYSRNECFTRRNWLSAFRAFAWGLELLNRKVGATILTPKVPRADRLIVAFHKYGRRVGLAKQTLRRYCRDIHIYKKFLTSRGLSWPICKLSDLDDFLHDTGKSKTRSVLTARATALRAWLKFLFVVGRTKNDLSIAVLLPPSVFQSKPASTLAWSDIRKLGRGIDRNTAIGRRDFAQYILFCTYGLSNAEVIALTLDQIDWSAGILYIRRVKNGSAFALPLLPSVAKAIAAYLCNGRPKSKYTNVFVRHVIPFNPLSHATIGQRIYLWAKHVGVDARPLGTHSFRHSVATRQLEHGIPLKTIGDILGHRSCRTTSIYVRTALTRLRKLALPVPK